MNAAGQIEWCRNEARCAALFTAGAMTQQKCSGRPRNSDDNLACSRRFYATALGLQHDSGIQRAGTRLRISGCMLNLFKKLFSKSEVLPTIVDTRAPEPSEPALPIPRVETAALSLAAIIDRFPDTLKQNVAEIPGDGVTIALPVSSIVKQLPGGSVKMSLASVYRQAPEGTFKSTRLEDKQMVEVPLAEIFKRVRPELLKRRDDQRANELADSGVDIFGDKANPYSISPAVGEPQPDPQEKLAEIAAPHAQSPPERVLRMTEPMIPAPPPGITPIATLHKPEPTCMPTSRVEAASAAPIPSVVAAAAAVELASAKAAEAHAGEPPIVLRLADLAVCWTDEVRSEIAKLDGATVSLASGDVAAGLAKGKVMFTWGQLRHWIDPAPAAGQLDPALELQLPLRVVAPAFLKSQKETNQRKQLPIDETIPELFVPNSHSATDESTLTLASSTGEVQQDSRVRTAAELAPMDSATRDCAAIDSARHVPTPATPDKPSLAPPTARPTVEPQGSERRTPALTMAQLFGEPQKTEWSPAEIVQHIIKLPQVAGAIVALQEGLVVAHELPEPMRGEVLAAFLPQLYARLNQYADEMKLGEIDEVLLSTNGAQLQLFRLGYVFFAVLSEPGATLPSREMRLIADELARQTDK